MASAKNNDRGQTRRPAGDAGADVSRGTSRGRKPRTVPVAARTVESRSRPRSESQRARNAKGAGRGAGSRQRAKIDLLGYAIILFILLAILWAVATPLRNYYSGRAEIARLEESISAKQAEKDRLLEEIDKYKSDAYAAQEARRRLGLVEEGETAYRIMDPHMNNEDSVTTDRRAEEDKRPWYEVLWDSVTEDPSLLDGSESATGDHSDGMRLPVEPDPDPDADPDPNSDKPAE